MIEEKNNVEEFKLSQVTIDEGSMFYENRDRIEEFLLNVDDDEMLFNFREAASLDTKGAMHMSGWDAPESLVKGHTTGHYLSSLALTYTGSKLHKDTLKKKMDYLISELGKCQDAMEKSGKFSYGFLSGYSEEQFDKLEEYEVYPKIWAPYYTLHKIMAGLLCAYEHGENIEALNICSKMGIWVYNRLSKLTKEQLSKMWSLYIAGEFGGMNEVLARLYKIHHKEEYIKAAKLFDNEKLFHPMYKNIDALENIHANQHIPQVIGAMEIYKQTGEEIYYKIAENFWNIVVSSHTYNIGGTGEGEMFRAKDQEGSFLSNKTAESCASYNMLKLTKMLFQYDKDSKYMDYYEKTLYNHIVASCDKSGPTGGSTYFMPLSPCATREFDIKENTCCHGTGLENHVKYQESIFFKDGDILYVNLYIPSTLHWHEKDMRISIKEDFLKTKKSSIHIDGEGFIEFRLRVPSWVLDEFKIKINDEIIEHEVKNGYAIVKGNFTKGDILEVFLPFFLKIKRTKDMPEIASLFYGPIVMAIASEDTNFVEICEDEILKAKIEENDLKFKIGKYDLVPFYDAYDIKYHAYFKIL